MKGFSGTFLFFALLTLELYVILPSAQGCSRSYVVSLNAESSKTHIITSPNYPLNYPSSTYCQWRITAPSGYVIQIKVTNIDTSGGYGSCSGLFDVLEIYNSNSRSSSNLRGKYCGKTLPADLTSTGRYMYLRFYANSAFPGTGFRLQYKAVKDPVDDYSTCSPFNSDYTNNNLKLTASSSDKYIQSPYYPNKYPSGIKCTWIISALSSSKRIKLTITNAKIMNFYEYLCSDNSLKDSLTIRDGSSRYSPVLKDICGKIYSSTTVTSTGQKMRIQFMTNTDNYFKGTTVGFKARFVEVNEEDTNVTGMIVGIIFAIIVITGFITCCVCLAKRRGHLGYVQANAATTVQTTSTTTTHPHPAAAPQYPMQIHAGPPPHGSYPPPAPGISYPPPAPGGSYPPPASGGSYPPPGPGGSYPPPAPGGSYPPSAPGGSYPPSGPGGSYPPPAPGGSYPQPPQGSGYPPNIPPPQYPGPPAYPPQSNEPHNPQFQPNPPYPPPQGSENQAAVAYPTKANAPPQF